MGTGVLSTATDLCKRSAFEPRPFQETADLTIMARQKNGCQMILAYHSVLPHSLSVYLIPILGCTLPYLLIQVRPRLGIIARPDFCARLGTYRTTVRGRCAGAFV